MPSAVTLLSGRVRDDLTKKENEPRLMKIHINNIQLYFLIVLYSISKRLQLTSSEYTRHNEYSADTLAYGGQCPLQCFHTDGQMEKDVHDDYLSIYKFIIIIC